MNIDTQKAKLTKRRAELIGEIREIEDKLDAPMPKDWEDRASERQGDEVLESLGVHDDSELQRIDAALGRIDDGCYGVCVRCGRAISDERLAALPETPFCRDCA